jgi:hypothetical protein
LECAAAMPRGNVAAAAAGAGQRTQGTLFSHGFSASASSRTGITSTPGAAPPPPRSDGGDNSGTGSGVAGRDARDDGSSSEEEEARSEDDEEEDDDESDEDALILDAVRSDDDENDEDKDARGNALGLIVPSDEETEDSKDSCDSDDTRDPSALLNKQRRADDDDMDDDEDDDDDDDDDDDTEDDDDTDNADMDDDDGDADMGDVSDLASCCGHRHDSDMDDVDTVDDDTDDEGTNAMDDGTGSGYGSGRAAPPSTPAAARPARTTETPLRNEDLSLFKIAVFDIVKSPGWSLRTPGGSNTERHEQKAVRAGPYKGRRVECLTRRGDRPDKSKRQCAPDPTKEGGWSILRGVGIDLTRATSGKQERS